jgi:alcohol dehydrogenase
MDDRGPAVAGGWRTGGQGGGTVLPEFFEFHNPTKVVYGEGIATDLQAELAQLPARRYFVVSDGVIDGIGLLANVKAGLESAGVVVAGEFLDVPQNSEVKVVEACAEAAAECGADGWVALGGGSVMDTAKAANILLCEGGDLVQDHSGAQTLTRPLKPLVAIPTTAGTGSEVTMVAVVYDREARVKTPFTDKFLLPDLAVLDPRITVSMPPGLTASTAMDALTHAMEAYVGPQWSPHSDALAAEAIRLVFGSVEAATRQGNDLDARGALLIASNLAGIAFTHSMVGCVHGMAHSVGALCHVPHGVANAILLPHGLDYNFEEIKEKLAALAPAVGRATAGMAVERAAAQVIQAVRELTVRLNALGAIPLRLRDAGVPEQMLPEVAELTVMDGTSFYNPREVVAEDILDTLKRAF